MNLTEKIYAVYPSLALDPTPFFDGTIRLRNDLDERGDYIESWNHPTLPRPTPEQLEAAQPTPIIPPDPVGFRRALITRSDLLPIYQDITVRALSSIAITHSVWMLDASFWNEPWIPAATQSALYTLGSVYSFSDSQKSVINAALAEFGLTVNL